MAITMELTPLTDGPQDVIVFSDGQEIGRMPMAEFVLTLPAQIAAGIIRPEPNGRFIPPRAPWSTPTEPAQG